MISRGMISCGYDFFKTWTGPKGKMIQDTINMDDVDHMSFDMNNCPSCKHRFVLSVGNSLENIYLIMKLCVGSNHMKAMTLWNRQLSTRRGPKPIVGPITSQHLACMCQNALFESN